MKRDLRDKKQELFYNSMKLRRLDLSGIDFDRAQQIRKMQDDCWKKHLFYKNYLTEVDKMNSKENKK